MKDDVTRQDLVDVQADAMELADRLPAVMFEARKVSHTVAHGVHGRKRSGPGDNFWQFRKFYHGDTAGQIDWRKSASSNNLFIREKEWEAAHTVWMWPDLSPSMAFQSNLTDNSKRERGLVLMMALSQILINTGERVGILGYSTPTANRNVIGKLAEVVYSILSGKHNIEALPPQIHLSPLSECVIFSDCLEPLDEQMERYHFIASQGVRGHVVQILDPVEETFPYTGRTEFRSHEGGRSVVIERAEGVRRAYRDRLQALKQDLKHRLIQMNWSYMVHHTDRPASEALLALYSRISGASDVSGFAQSHERISDDITRERNGDAG